MKRIWCFCATVLPVVWVLAGCTAGQRTVASSPAGEAAEVAATAATESDTALFAAVVRELESRPMVPARVDPRPLIADPAIWSVAPEHLADVPDSIVQQRAAVLDRLSVAETDAVADAGCAGGYPPDRSRARMSACPEEGQYYSFALGLPRSGGAYMPAGVFPASADAREEGLAEGHMAVRVIKRLMTPRGASGAVWDFIFQRDAAEWRLVKMVNLLVID